MERSRFLDAVEAIQTLRQLGATHVRAGDVEASFAVVGSPEPIAPNETPEERAKRIEIERENILMHSAGE